MTELPAHSPLGGSGADRWGHCPGSVGLSTGVPDDEDDAFSGPGRAAHTLAQICLEAGYDAWEMMGLAIEHELGEHVNASDAIPRHWELDKVIYVDKEMADAVQVYLSAAREAHPDRNQGNTFIETAFHCPEIHEHFYGRSDLSYLGVPTRKLDVWDYKHGAGIIVEVPWNWQEMYYACGVLTKLHLWNDIDTVELHIVQPRGWHFDGPHRAWTITTDDLAIWLVNKLMPAMDRAMKSDDTESGEHCRFCPVRGMKCPQIMADFARAKELHEMEALSPAETGEFLTLWEVLKIAHKQHLARGTAAANAGKDIPGWKLSKARSNRIWKDGAEEQLVDIFGDDAYTSPGLKNPAVIEKLPKGKETVTRLAFKPDAGLTLTKASDNRPAVKRDRVDAFKKRDKP